MALVTTSAILLRSHPYSESSRILRWISRDGGVVSTMARGVRRAGSRTAPGLDTFAQGQLSYDHRDGRDLHTMREFAVQLPRRGLGRDPLRLAAASVLGELVLRHGGEGEGAQVFDALAAALDAVEQTAPEAVAGTLLAEGWGLVVSLGYRPHLEGCPACGAEPDPDEVGRFDFELAGVRCAACATDRAGPRIGPGARAQLAELIGGRCPDTLVRVRPHLQLLSDFIAHHVAGGRPLDAFRVLAALLPPEPAS